MSEPKSFAALLWHLIETVHPPDRPPYSYREIAAGIEARGGTTMSSTYINQLATGKRENPGINAVQALADFFGVPIGYFADDAVTEEINAQLRAITQWRDGEALATAERIMSLEPRDRRTVTSLLDSLESYEAQPRATRRRRKPASDEGA
ncbi:helix-turn-helix domain-containing protein [Amycolatopsis minnesotensis]|uniref:HTH cro/C1-type domain-containing protein n=1 Tax=Amycolatopsis minnesotensis TaxID=337894 RepID=A0ABN2SS65_9PSEU